MLHVFRRHLGLAMSASSLLAVEGCSLGDIGATASPGAGPGGQDVGAGSGGSSRTTSTGSGGVTTGAGGSGTTMPPGPPPPDSCNRALPASFTTHCSACHTASGQPNMRYPDLYKFQGTLADFTMRVRTGSSKGMAAYPPDLVSDVDVA